MSTNEVSRVDLAYRQFIEELHEYTRNVPSIEVRRRPATAEDPELLDPVVDESHKQTRAFDRAARFLLAMDARHGQKQVTLFLERYTQYLQTCEEAFWQGQAHPQPLKLLGYEKTLLHEIYPLMDAPFYGHTRRGFLALGAALCGLGGYGASNVESNASDAYFLERDLESAKDDQKEMKKNKHRSPAEDEYLQELTQKTIPSLEEQHKIARQRHIVSHYLPPFMYLAAAGFTTGAIVDLGHHWEPEKKAKGEALGEFLEYLNHALSGAAAAMQMRGHTPPNWKSAGSGRT